MPTLSGTASSKVTMDDPAALYELISVLKDHVIEQVGFFLDRSSIAEIGGDEGDDAAQSWVLDCLAAASTDFPFLAEVSWDAEREWRAARRRLRLDGVKISGRKGNECFRSLNNIYEEDDDDGQQRDDGGDVASSPPRWEDGSDGGDGQKKYDHDDDGAEKSVGGGQCMRDGCTKYRRHGCGLFCCRNCSKLHRGWDTPKPTLKPAEGGKAAVTKRKRQSWDENLADFIRWKEEHGHPHVPIKGEHSRLSHWVQDQRKSYKALREGTEPRRHQAVMTEERAAKLREAGFAFEGEKRRKRISCVAKAPNADVLEVDPPPVAEILDEAEIDVEALPREIMK